MRRRQLSLEDLYLPDGRYGRWNWAGIAATLLGLRGRVGWLDLGADAPAVRLRVVRGFWRGGGGVSGRIADAVNGSPCCSMFLTRRPSPQEVVAFITESRDLPMSYEPIGLAHGVRSGFDVDEQVTVIGRGGLAFERAKLALTQWKHFDLGWVEVFPGDAALTEGTVVGVLVRHLGFWSLNGCRVVYSIGCDSAQDFGYAYGTLTNHLETGEEIFKVSLHPHTGEVSYSIRAVSRPQALLAQARVSRDPQVPSAFQTRFSQSSRASDRPLTIHGAFYWR